MIFLASSGIDFSASNTWSFLIILAVLFFGILLAHILKTNLKFLKKTLIPASVLGGLLVLIFSFTFNKITKINLFDTTIFSVINGSEEIALSGSDILQILTYHCLGIGFVAMSLRTIEKNKRSSFKDVFNTGVTTVATYVLQAIVGIVITLIFSFSIAGLTSYSGVILCLGFGQGTGQALNWGNIYETAEVNSLVHGANFGLTIAAMGFLVACIFGVIYMNLLKKKGKIVITEAENETHELSDYQTDNDISMTGSLDKFTVQLALVVIVYALSYALMHLLGSLANGLKSTFFGFNFLLGTLMGIILKSIINALKNKGIIKREYINNFMMNRISGVAFDIMIIAGIAVIDLNKLVDYWYVVLILTLVGGVATFLFIRFICHRLFPNYRYEQFFAMFGMLTGTASTGMILLREIDPKFESPASSNLVYQNFPAIVFGIPLIMLLLPKLPTINIYLALGLIVAFFIVLCIILFRSLIFKRKVQKQTN